VGHVQVTRDGDGGSRGGRAQCNQALRCWWCAVHSPIARWVHNIVWHPNLQWFGNGCGGQWGGAWHRPGWCIGWQSHQLL